MFFLRRTRQDTPDGTRCPALSLDEGHRGWPLSIRPHLRLRWRDWFKMDACPDPEYGCFYPEAYLSPGNFLEIIVIGVVIGLALVGARFVMSKLFKRRRR
ncbi:MAG: hypothetical protein Q8M90_06390 [Brevundimonas sp.]|nr:hypothetical protein [Brevundimonas sp.]MDZ4059931.1 hypothetical protein [Brevundimonas sp.]